MLYIPGMFDTVEIIPHKPDHKWGKCKHFRPKRKTSRPHRVKRNKASSESRRRNR